MHTNDKEFILDTHLISLLFHKKPDGIANELRVLLDYLPDTALLQVLCLVLLQVKGDLGASAQWLTC